MAIEKIVKINVDASKGNAGLSTFNDSLVETETKSQSLKAELRQLKEQLSKLDEGTEQYKTIAKRAGQVSDSIGDINARIKHLGSDTRHIDTVVAGANAMSGAFSVATSASAMLGGENEDLQKSMMKVESAIGLTVGVQSIANALQKESAIVIGATSLATKAQIAVQNLWTVATTATTGATKALKVALISTGVGAIVVLLGYLVSKLMEASDSTTNFKNEQDKLNASLERYNRLIEENLKMIDHEEKVAVLRAKIAGKTEEDISKITKSFGKKRLAELEDDLKNKENLEIKYSKDLSSKLSQLDADAKKEAFDKEENVRSEVDKARQAVADERRNQETGNLEEDLKVADDFRDKQKQAQEKANAEAKERREREAKERKEAQEKEIAEYNEFQYNISQADTDQYLLKQQQKLDDIENEKAWMDEISAISDKQAEDNVNRLNKETDAKIELRKKEKEAFDSHTTQMAGVLEGFSELVGKHTVAGKAMAVAAATINTFKGVSEVWGAKSMGNPVVDMVVKIASTALVVASGIANVKKILSVKIPTTSGGGGAGGGGISGVSAPTPPSFNIVGQNSNNQLAQTISNRQQQPIEAFVVSGNVTNAQSLDRNRQNTATFN